MARILLAEDQEDLREMIAISLRLDGHQVVLAADGQEALQQAKDTSPDLFILISRPKAHIKHNTFRSSYFLLDLVSVLLRFLF